MKLTNAAEQMTLREKIVTNAIEREERAKYLEEKQNDKFVTNEIVKTLVFAVGLSVFIKVLLHVGGM